MNHLTGQEVVSYNQNQAGDLSNFYIGDNVPLNNTFYEYYHTYYPIYYPTYHYVESKSKIEQAFKIVGKLFERKIITKDLTVKEFMKLVNDIAEVI
jgi:hypothetical protein